MIAGRKRSTPPPRDGVGRGPEDCPVLIIVQLTLMLNV